MPVIFSIIQVKIIQVLNFDTLLCFDSRFYGVSRYERYVTSTLYIREHTWADTPWADTPWADTPVRRRYVAYTPDTSHCS